MLSENIRKFRKSNNMSQDELAEKLEVSRQSVSLWENGQTQPTVDNIIALTKIFNISANDLLGDETGVPMDDVKPSQTKTKGPNKIILLIIIVVLILLIAGLIVFVILRGNKSQKPGEKKPEVTEINVTETPEITVTAVVTDVPTETPTQAPTPTQVPTQENTPAPTPTPTKVPTPVVTQAPTNTPKPTEKVTPTPTPVDLFEYSKTFAIDIGRLNGDYTIYMQPSSKYGGYEGENFDISYWGDSNMVEFCLNCPLSETMSINFYLRMRGGFNGKYEYLVSKYYRSNGNSIRSASGYIDPSVFSEKYPLPCDYYNGDGGVEKQNEFMEEARVGMCDLIKCLKQFVSVEGMKCGWQAFGFKNF